MPTDTSELRRTHSRLPRTPKVTAGRRGAHAADRAGARTAGSPVATQVPHITPNAIAATGGAWEAWSVKRFARWLTDGATDRPHLRF